MFLRSCSIIASRALRISSAGVLVAAPLAAQVPVTIGTRVPVTLTEALSSKSAKKGAPLPVRVDADVVVRGVVVIPKGAPLFGTVTEAKKAGRFGHGGELSIRVDSVRGADGHMIPVFADLRDTTSAGNDGQGGAGSRGANAVKDSVRNRVTSVVPGSAAIVGAFQKGDDIEYAANMPVPVFTAAYVMMPAPASQPAPSAQVPAVGDSSAATGPPPAALAFFSSMHTLDLALGSLAAHLSATPGVRNFGQQIVREDTPLLAAANALAAQYNITIPAPAPAEVDKLNELVRNLRALSGTAFDEALLHQIYELEHNFVDGLDEEDATPIGPLLVKTAPVWKDHMTSAAKLLVPPGAGH